MRDFLRQKSGGGGGRVQSDQVCSRQHGFLPHREASVSERDIQMWLLLFFFFSSCTELFPRTVMQSSSNGVIHSSCLSPAVNWTPCLSNSNRLHRLQYSQQRTYLPSGTIHQWMCLCAKKWKVIWKDLSRTWMASSPHSTFVFFVTFEFICFPPASPTGCRGS